LVDMIREDLVAGCFAIDSFGEIVRYLDENEPASR
jgi:hypothetical protein